MDNSGVICKVIDFSDTKIDKDAIQSGGLRYIGNFVKKRICESSIASNEIEQLSDTDVILNYPVVYVHTWQEKDVPHKKHYYVGETIDLAQRTNEHSRRGKAENGSWQAKWLEVIECGRAKSYYFSHLEMNKSLSLDVENYLIELLEDDDIKNENGRGNPQGNYSNKSLLKDIVTEIMVKLGHDRKKCELLWDQKKNDLIQEKYEGNSKLNPKYKKVLLSKELVSENHNTEKWKNAIENAEGSSNVPIGLFLNYPVVYMHTWVTEETVKNESKYVVNTYVGETNNLAERTSQHYNNTEDELQLELIDGELIENKGWQGKKDSWREAVNDGKAVMMVFAHRAFNKSVTMDIENRLIQYTIFTETSVNGRTNEQRKYGGKDSMYDLFGEIVDGIIVPELKNNREKFYKTFNVSDDSRRPEINEYLDRFKTVKSIQEDSVFIAAPFLKPCCENSNDGQVAAIKGIKDCVLQALNDKKKTLIAVRGSAGTGKTVLASQLFFDLRTTEINDESSPIDCRLIVNHDELYNLYGSMAERWQLGKETDKGKRIIWKATAFLNYYETKQVDAPDVVLIDEAHLLHRVNVQGKVEGTKNGEQLSRIIELASVVIIMYDPLQVTRPGRIYLDTDMLKKICREKDWSFNEYHLSIQMRMDCGDRVKQWISSLSSVDQNGALPKFDEKPDNGDGYVGVIDEKGYNLRIYDDPDKMNKAIEDKKPFSCLLATFEWKYHKGTEDKTIMHKFFWHETRDKGQGANSWTEKPENGEVGAIHDIQGFDLQYAGVILGKSVGYRNGKMEFLKKDHKGRIPNDKKEAARIIANEVGVLLTRGKKGLYIYAEDEDLRDLMKNSLTIRRVERNSPETVK